MAKVEKAAEAEAKQKVLDSARGFFVRVSQVLPDGLLVQIKDPSGPTEPGAAYFEPEYGGLKMLEGVPNSKSYAEGQEFRALLVIVGVYNYTDAHGVRQPLEKHKYVGSWEYVDSQGRSGSHGISKIPITP